MTSQELYKVIQRRLNGNMTTTEEQESVYLDWINNFLTIAGFASHYDISESDSRNIITWSRESI
jgi:hypothetical protein